MIKLIDLLKEVEDFDLSDNPFVAGTDAESLLNKFSSQNKPIRLAAGRRHIKGVGRLYKIEDIATAKKDISKDVTTYLSIEDQGKENSEIYNELEAFLTEASLIAKYFKITWIKIALFKDFYARDYETMGNTRRLDIDFGVTGKDSLGQEFAFVKKKWNSWLINSENRVELPHDFHPSNEQQMQDVKDQLFPKAPPEPKRKRANINDLFQSPYATDVFLTHGKIKRGGFGVKSKYDKLEEYLTTYQLERIKKIAEVGQIKWDDMIIYGNGNSNNFAINGIDKDGDEVLYSYHGSGMGASTKFYKGSNVVYATGAEELY